MSSKRQQTMAKLTRERTVKEKRERKQERKRERKLAAAAERELAANPLATPEDGDGTSDQLPEPGFVEAGVVEESAADE